MCADVPSRRRVDEMNGRFASVIAAMALLSVQAARGQDAAGASGSDHAAPVAARKLTTDVLPDSPPPAPRGNPLSRISIDSLSVTRERPLFSASRRPPPPKPAPTTPPAPNVEAARPAEPERPPLILEGTAIGKPRAIALVLDETTKGSVRLHVGEAAEGWQLRSIDARRVTVEKTGRVVTLSLPTPAEALTNTNVLASDDPAPPGKGGWGKSRSKNIANWISRSPVFY